MAYIIVKYADDNNYWGPAKLDQQLAYDGYSCAATGVKPAQIYKSKKEAEKDLEKLRNFNPSVCFGLRECTATGQRKKVNEADLFLGATELLEQAVRLIPKPTGKMQSTKALTFLISSVMYIYLKEHEEHAEEQDRHFLMCNSVIYACLQMYIMRLKDHKDLIAQKIILQAVREFFNLVLDATEKVLNEEHPMPLNLPGDYSDWRKVMEE